MIRKFTCNARKRTHIQHKHTFDSLDSDGNGEHSRESESEHAIEIHWCLLQCFETFV